MTLKIKAVALDVDGVLTDGTFWWNSNGEECKRFSFLDIMGISLGSRAGLVFALISGEDNILVDRLAKKLNINDVFKNCKDKSSALREFADRYDLPLKNVCFMGDDVNDLSAMALAGMSAAPVSAHYDVKERVMFITKSKGGQGAVRELIEHILVNNQ